MLVSLVQQSELAIYIYWYIYPLSSRLHSYTGYGTKSSPMCSTVGSYLSFIYSSVYIGEGNGTPCQCSCLENPMDRGAWKAAVHGVAMSQTWLSNFTFTFPFHALEKEMANHSSVLAWRIPGMGEPGGLLSMGSHRVGHDWSDSAAAVYICQRRHLISVAVVHMSSISCWLDELKWPLLYMSPFHISLFFYQARSTMF